MTPCPHRSRRRAEGGFTLIEIMMVLVIIGIIVTFATLSGSGRAVDDRIEEEARRLARVVQLTVDEALIHGLELGLLVSEDGYRLVMLDRNQGRWVDYGESSPLRPRALPAPMRLSIIVDGYESKLAPSVQASVDASRSAATLSNDGSDGGNGSGAASEDEEPVTPQAFFLSSGEASPFVVELGLNDQPALFRIEADVLGRVRVERKPGES